MWVWEIGVTRARLTGGGGGYPEGPGPRVFSFSSGFRNKNLYKAIEEKQSIHKNKWGKKIKFTLVLQYFYPDSSGGIKGRGLLGICPHPQKIKIKKHHPSFFKDWNSGYIGEY